MKSLNEHIKLAEKIMSLPENLRQRIIGQVEGCSYRKHDEENAKQKE